MTSLKTGLLIIVTQLFLAGTGACTVLAPAPTPTPSPSPTPIPQPVAPVDEERTLTVDGRERTYYLYIPDGLNDQQPVPLVYFFHGYQELGRLARSYTGFDKLADQNGFVVVFGEGSDYSWNAGLCCGSAVQENIDDEAYVRAIRAEVEAILHVDPKRIYASGFSNGGLLTYRLACEMADTFAAVAPAGSTLVTNPCEPSEPVSLLHIHGASDRVVPIEGGVGGSGLNFPPVGNGLEAWAKLDGCTGEKAEQQDGVLTHTTYGNCAPGIAVETYTVSGIGHSWPSQYVAPISQIVWQFFASHPKP